MTSPEPETKELRLYCPVCGREKQTPRDPTDPPAAVEIAICCDKCCNGHKDCSAHYYDEAGEEVGIWTENE